MNDTAYIYARVPQELHARVKGAADDRGISITQFVTQVLEEATESVQVPLKAVPLKDGGWGYVFFMSPEMWNETREVVDTYADNKSS
jgi:antitoxin component of RelBE/YafQ-DinJ toxin-antitoxin module